MSNYPLITGIGIICSLGDTIETIYDSISEKKALDYYQASKTIENFDSRNYLGREAKLVRFMSKETEFTAIAVSRAMKEAQLDKYDPYDIAIYAGTGSTGIDMNDISKMLNASIDETGQFNIDKFGSEALYSLNPLISFQILPNMPVCVASIHSKIKGNNQVFNPWEGNSAQALVEAFYDIKNDSEKCVIVGGSDYKTNSGSLITLKQYGLINNQEGDLVGKPFDENSKGFIRSDGSAYIIVEKEADNPYCEVLAIETCSDATSNLGYSKNSEALEILIANTIEKAGLKKEMIGLIISSADGNYTSDKMELQVLEKFFGSNLPELITPKEFTGNVFAASTYIHIALGAYILKNNLRTTDYILITGFGIGSEKYCCILGKIKEE